MRCKFLALCALFAGLATMARAQAPGSFTIQCGPQIVTEEITKTWVIGTFNCTTDATINGVPFKTMTHSATAQYGATETNVWGVIVGVLANSDQVFFEYHTVGPVKNGVAGIGTMTYKKVGGTGIANGITGSGTCTVPPSTPSGSPAHPCVGTYATR
jgi:hypothetical protein